MDGNADGLPTYSKNDIVAAVLDSGIDPGHIDLDGGKIIGWKDFATGQANPYDQVAGCGDTALMFLQLSPVRAKAMYFIKEWRRGGFGGRESFKKAR